MHVCAEYCVPRVVASQPAAGDVPSRMFTRRVSQLNIHSSTRTSRLPRPAAMSRLAKRHPDLLVSLPPPLTRTDPPQSCNFNQDYSCIAVGHRRGYTILNCDPFGKVHSNSTSLLLAAATEADSSIDDQGSTGIVEMLFCTSLVALVGAAENQPSNSPRKLQIVNTKVGILDTCALS